MSSERGGRLRIATLNLYHWAAPPIWWYGVDAAGTARHSEESWRAKGLWLAALLAEMDADVVGFQEVVSVDALSRLCAEAGYGAFFAAGAPRIVEEQGERVYVRPVQAVASRLPMQAAALSAPDGFGDLMGLGADWAFRRAPVVADLETAAFGAIRVVCAHLKSAGASIDEGPWRAQLAPDMSASARAREIAAARARGHVASVRQRTAEAAALQAASFEWMAAAPARALVLLGDFNDTPGSPALRAMTASVLADPDADADMAAAARFWRLHDTADLAPAAQLSGARASTHSAATVLDYVVASSGLDGSEAALGGVAAHRVFDAHLRNGSGAAESSDHAAVLAVFEPG